MIRPKSKQASNLKVKLSDLIATHLPLNNCCSCCRVALLHLNINIPFFKNLRIFQVTMQLWTMDSGHHAHSIPNCFTAWLNLNSFKHEPRRWRCLWNICPHALGNAIFILSVDMHLYMFAPLVRRYTVLLYCLYWLHEAWLAELRCVDDLWITIQLLQLTC